MTLSSQILDSAAADPTSSAWDLIWRESCHQGTCDPASAVLLPWLAQTCTAFSREGRENALILAGLIALDASGADRDAYTDEIAAMRALAVDCLPSASSDSTFVYLQQANLPAEEVGQDCCDGLPAGRNGLGMQNRFRDIPALPQLSTTSEPREAVGPRRPLTARWRRSDLPMTVNRFSRRRAGSRRTLSALVAGPGLGRRRRECRAEAGRDRGHGGM